MSRSGGHLAVWQKSMFRIWLVDLSRIIYKSAIALANGWPLIGQTRRALLSRLRSGDIAFGLN